MEKTGQSRRGLGKKQGGGRIAGKKRRLSGPAAAALGTGTALAGYGALLAGASALLVRGALPEERLGAITGVCCLAAVLTGGCVSALRSAWPPLPAACSVGAVMAAILVMAGLCASEPPDWAGQGGPLMLCALGGGLLAGWLMSRRARWKRRL